MPIRAGLAEPRWSRAQPDGRTPRDLDVAHAGPDDARRHRLADGFLGRPAPGPALGTAAAVGDLSVSQELVQKALAEASMDICDARDRRHIYADPRGHAITLR